MTTIGTASDTQRQFMDARKRSRTVSGTGSWSCTIDPWIIYLLTSISCAPEIYTFASQMIKQEVGAALMCDVNQCPVCACPHDEQDRVQVSYPYCDTETVKAAVKAAKEQHLDDDGEVLDCHHLEVRATIIHNQTRYDIR